MRISIEHIALTKQHPLTISRGTSAGSNNLLVTVEHDGVLGIGEMAPTSGGAIAETADSAAAAIIGWRTCIESLTPWDWQEIELRIAAGDLARQYTAARAALDMAIWDWRGKALGQPVWRLLGLNLGRIPVTSVTVGINPPEIVRERVVEILQRTGARSLKVKLGSPAGEEQDRLMFAAAQEAANSLGSALEVQPLWRVDANGGWSVDTAIRMTAWLAERGVSYVEQPLLRGREADLPKLHAESALPIYADESIYLSQDIPAIADSIDGVNLKLMKCGGITEALRIVHTARAHGLKVMYGCMSETSLAISAAAQISSLADEVDLDSHLNLNPDPFTGALLFEGRVVPTDMPGLGTSRL